MKTDEDRVRSAVRALADAVPLVPPPAAAMRARAEASRRWQGRRWTVPVFAAAAVLALVAVVVTVPGVLRSGGGEAPAGQADRPVLPERFAGLSGRTVNYLVSPPGRAIALYHQGSRRPAGRDNSQQLVVGADGRTYRRLDWMTTEGAGAEQPWNGLSGALLSPDGSRLAVPGALNGDNVTVIDVITGEVARYPEVAGGTILAWSPDGGRIAVGLGPSVMGERPSGTAEVAVLDLATRETSHLPTGSYEPRAAAFSPDGELLAVHAEVADPEAYWASGSWEPEGGMVHVFDPEGNPQGVISLSPRQGLAPGGTAWSPDGRLLVVIEASGDPSTYGLAFLDATGEEGQVPVPFQAEREAIVLLGWRSLDTMLVGWDDGSSRGTNVIAEVPVGGDSARVVTEFSMDEHGWVTGLQLAPGLVVEADVRDPGPPSRGPSGNGSLPVIAVLVAALLIAGMVIVGFRRRATARTRQP